MSSEESPPKSRGRLAALKARLFGPAGIYLFAAVFARGGGLLLAPAYAWRLGPTLYGEYILAQTVITLGPPLLSLGLKATVTRIYFESEDRDLSATRMFGLARAYLGVVALNGSLVQLGVMFILSDGTGLFTLPVFSIVIWGGVLHAAWVVGSGTFKARQRPRLAVAFSLVQGGIQLVAGLAFGFDLLSCVLIGALSHAVPGIVGVGYLLLGTKGVLTRADFWRGLKLSLPYVPHLLALQAYAVAGRFVLKGLGLGPQLGQYSLAGQLLSPVNMGSTALNEAISPEMGELTRKGGVQSLRSRTRRFLAIYGGTAGVLGFGASLVTPVVLLLFKPEFSPVAWMVPLLALSAAFDALYFWGTNILFYANRTDLIPKLTMVSAVVALGLLVGLGIEAGVFGVCLARVLGSAFRTALFGGYGWRQFREGEVAAAQN